MENLQQILESFIQDNWIRVVGTISLVLLWFLVKANLKRFLHFTKTKNAFSENRYLYVKKMTNVILNIFSIVLLMIVWDVSLKGFSVYFASFFTVAGVALFAQWSILSNLTASLVLFLYFPYKIGDLVTVVGDEGSKGRIKDIGFFRTILETEEKEILSYPNNLLINKPIRVHKE